MVSLYVSGGGTSLALGGADENSTSNRSLDGVMGSALTSLFNSLAAKLLSENGSAFRGGVALSVIGPIFLNTSCPKLS